MKLAILIKKFVSPKTIFLVFKRSIPVDGSDASGSYWGRWGLSRPTLWGSNHFDQPQGTAGIAHKATDETCWDTQ